MALGQFYNHFSLRLMYPFFSYFLVLNIGNKSPLQMIPPGSNTPVIYFLIVFWPVLLVSLLHFFSARGTARFHAFFWLLALLASELFYINDIYAGSAERFNTTLAAIVKSAKKSSLNAVFPESFWDASEVKDLDLHRCCRAVLGPNPGKNAISIIFSRDILDHQDAYW